MHFGGRRIKTLLDGTVVPALNRWVFVKKPTAGTAVTVACDNGRVSVS
jgi:hypothetical protein